MRARLRLFLLFFCTLFFWCVCWWLVVLLLCVMLRVLGGDGGVVWCVKGCGRCCPGQSTKAQGQACNAGIGGAAAARRTRYYVRIRLFVWRARWCCDGVCEGQHAWCYCLWCRGCRVSCVMEVACVSVNVAATTSETSVRVVGNIVKRCFDVLRRREAHECEPPRRCTGCVDTGLGAECS